MISWGRKYLFLAAGFFFVGVGLIGVFVPVLPTTPFIILATFFFGKSSPRFAKWLKEHPWFGPSILAWEKHGAIPKNAKILAVFFMTLSGILVLRGNAPLIGKVCLVLTLILSAAYVLTRPSGPKSEVPKDHRS